MAVTPTPIFAQSNKTAMGQVSTANTARDGTGTLATLLTGNANGSPVYQLTVQATVTTTAGMVRFFISTDGGTTKRLFDEFPISAVTVGANTAGYRATKYYDNFFLADASAILYASTHNAEAINVFVDYGNY